MADDLDRQITDALNELRGARQIAEHEPTAQAQHTVDLCEWRLNGLLERRGAVAQNRTVTA